MFTLYFDPDSTYQLKLVTHADMEGYIPILDYVRFEQHNQTQPFQSWINPTGSTETGSELWMFDTGRGSVTGDGTEYKNGYIYTNYKFKRIYTAYVNVHCSATKVANVTNLDGATRFAYHIRDYQANNWTSTYNLSWWCFGLVEVPVVRPLTP